MYTDHMTVNMDRPMVEGRPRYQAKCSCGRRTEIGSRKSAEVEQKVHRRTMRREARAGVRS